MWVSGISDHCANSLISQCSSTKKSQWLSTVTSHLSWYEHWCKLGQTSKQYIRYILYPVIWGKLRPCFHLGLPVLSFVLVVTWNLAPFGNACTATPTHPHTRTLPCDQPCEYFIIGSRCAQRPLRNLAPYSPGTFRGGRMSEASTSRSGILGNPKVVGSNPDLAFSNPGRVKPITLELMLAAS